MSKSEDLFFNSIRNQYLSNSRLIKRDWLATEVKRLIADDNYRFILLTASPSMGKSTFLAQLAEEFNNRSLIYFIRRDQRSLLSDVGTHSFLLRIGYQFGVIHPELFEPKQLEIKIKQRIRSVEKDGEVIGAKVEKILESPFFENILKINQNADIVKGTMIGITVKEYTIDPRLIPVEDLQYMALIDPAWILLEKDPNAKVIILIDALDEIQYQPSRNNLLTWLTNVPELPANIKFILTSRPPDDELNTLIHKHNNLLKHLEIQVSDRRIKKEIKQYTDQLIEINEVKEILNTKSELQRFSDAIVNKANGNIGYLDAIGRGIDNILSLKQTCKNIDEKKALSDSLMMMLNFKELPSHLEGLYGFFLQQLKIIVGDRKVIIDGLTPGEYPLAWTSVYMPILGVLASVFEPMSIKQIGNLGEIKTDRNEIFYAINQLKQFLKCDDDRYYLYHTTFKEFLTSSSTEGNKDISFLYQDLNHWHQRIADYYVSNFSKNWHSLNDDYGFNNLALHMAALSQKERLCDLLNKEWIEARFEKSNHSYVGLLNDVNVAWQLVCLDEKENFIDLIRLKIITNIIVEYAGEFMGLYKDPFERITSTNLFPINEQPNQEITNLINELEEQGPSAIDYSERLIEAYEMVKCLPPDENKCTSLKEIEKLFRKTGDQEANEIVNTLVETVISLARESSNFYEVYDLVDTFEQSDTSRAQLLIEEALKVSFELKDLVKRQDILYELAIRMSRFDSDFTISILNESLKLSEIIFNNLDYVERGHSSYGNSSALVSTAVLLARFKDVRTDSFFERFETTFKKSIDPRLHDSWYETLCIALVDSSRLEMALIKAKNIKNNHDRLFTLSKIINKIAKRDKSKSVGIIQSIVLEVRNSRDEIFKSKIYNEIVKAFLLMENTKDAKFYADQISKEPWISYSYVEIIKSMAKEGKFIEGMGLISKIKISSVVGTAEIELAENLIKSGDVNSAESIAEKTLSSDTRYRILLAIAQFLEEKNDTNAKRYFERAELVKDDGLSELGNFKGACHTIVDILIDIQEFNRAYILTKWINDHLTRTRLLIELGTALAIFNTKYAQDIFQEAKNELKKIEDEWYKEQMLTGLGVTYAKYGFEKEAIELAYSSRFTYSSWRILTAFIIYLFETQDKRVDNFSSYFLELLNDADQINDAIKSLIKIAKKIWRLSQDQSRMIISFTEQYVRNMSDHTQRFKYLYKIASNIVFLDPLKSNKLINEIEEVARTHKDPIIKKDFMDKINSTRTKINDLQEMRNVISQLLESLPDKEELDHLPVSMDYLNPIDTFQEIIGLLPNNDKINAVDRILQSNLNLTTRKTLLVAYATVLSKNQNKRTEEIFNELENLISSNSNDYTYPDLRELPKIYFKAGLISRGLTIMSEMDMDHSIYLIGTCIQSMNLNNPDYVNNILINITEVASWYRLKWLNVHQIIANNLPDDKNIFHIDLKEERKSIFKKLFKL